MEEIRERPKNVNIPAYSTEWGGCLVTGYDYVQEAWKWSAGEELQDHLDTLKNIADRNGGRDGETFCEIAGEEFTIGATGAKGGVNWVLKDDDMMILISRNRGYDVSVRYLSAGLWEHGWNALRARFEAILRNGGFVEHDEPEHPRLTRVDYAMDFQSQAFENEDMAVLAQQIISSHKRKTKVTKKITKDDGTRIEIWAQAGKIETLTIGKMPGLQIQVYNKTKEITDISGKEWMREIWQRGGCYEPEKTVFRLEVRFTKDWLKNRRVRTKEQFQGQLRELWTDALMNNRMVIKKKAGNETVDVRMRRWDTHPLWGMAIILAGSKTLPPLGRRTVGRRKALRDRLVDQLAGTLRSTTVLANKEYDFTEMLALAEEAMIRVEDDDRHEWKTQNAKARYSEVDEAR